LLLISAYLKFRDLTWEPFGKALVISPRLRILVVEMEAALGIWLLAGIARRALWIVATGFFGALAAVSAYLASNGEPTCGCFGQVTISPWLTLGLDVLAMSVLILTRPSPNPSPREQRFGPVLIWTLVAVVLGGVVLIARHGGPASAWHAFAGQTLLIEPSLAEIGAGQIGHSRSFVVNVSNVSNVPVRIVVGTNNCIANAVCDLPIMIPPGESRAIRIEGHFRGSPGRMLGEFGFWTDQARRMAATGRFAGTILQNR
jgi:hypothetical protein